MIGSQCYQYEHQLRYGRVETSTAALGLRIPMAVKSITPQEIEEFGRCVVLVNFQIYLSSQSLCSLALTVILD